jgi:hypothetical protein
MHVDRFSQVKHLHTVHSLHSIRQHTQHTSTYVIIHTIRLQYLHRRHVVGGTIRIKAYVSTVVRQHTQHTSSLVIIRQHTSAYVSIRSVRHHRTKCLQYLYRQHVVGGVIWIKSHVSTRQHTSAYACNTCIGDML